MTEKILFVDDDPHILNAFQRKMRKSFKLMTASSGAHGLEVIREHGPFAVVVSDMRMPEMDGIAFLKKVQEVSPESVLLMLTGNADQQTAIDAVNEGRVFRFLTKPCSVELLSDAIEAALKQYRLIHAEQELLEGTLNGTINLLVEILSLAATDISTCDLGMRQTATEVARALRVNNTWAMEMATMLAHVAHITLPPDTQAKLSAGQLLTPAEQRIVDSLPETGYKLLANIPRLKEVANIILYQNKNFDGSGFPADSVSGEEIPMESRILRVLHDFKRRTEEGVAPKDALELMQEGASKYDPRVLQTVAWFFSDGAEDVNTAAPIGVGVKDLRGGQLLVTNVETESGRLLFTAGQKLSEAIVERLINYHQVHKIKEPIMVAVPRDA